MTDLPVQLSASLAERYRLERELGRGGMATVYLAHDDRHGRRVALKVLHPELATTLGPERFLREIRTAARLQHPHILPIFDSGKAAGRLWYTMPYVEGESLRVRLRREIQLPVEEALRITREVALALDYAHRHGVVHRDIKPENILLADGQALVADFGVARALGEGAEDRLTETGMAVGTLAYMSPEQAAGEGQLDGRSDEYSLGCVLYELLTGEPPFTGRTPQAVIAKRILDPLPRVRTLRESVPEALERALVRAMARAPADRFPTAAEFARALDDASPVEAEGAARSAASQAHAVQPSRRRIAAAVVALLALMVLGAVVLRQSRSTLPPLDAELLAVAPFDVLDPSLQLWQEGLADLLARNLDGAGPLRTVSPTVVIRSWKGRADRVAAEALAKRTGAGLTVYGTLVPEGRDSVRLAASVLDAVQGAVAAEAEARGPADQVARLADSLALRLLGELGQQRPLGGARSGGLGTRSLPALRAFLRGEQHFRRANWDSAQVSYHRALELDTAFALAYWRMGVARRWETRMDDSLGQSYVLRAAGLNKGLPPRESLLISCDSLQVVLPGAMLVDSATDYQIERLFRTARVLTQHYPSDPESWAALGEAGAHFGAGHGVGEESQLEAFARAIALDSTFAPAYFHAIELAALVEDWTTVRQYAVSLLALRPGWDDGASFARTVVRILDRRPSSAEVDRLIDTVSVAALVNIVNTFTSATDSEEIGIRVGRSFSKRRSLFDEETRQGLFAGTLAYRGHLREASQLLGRHPGLMAAGTFTELAMFGLIPPDSANAVFERQIVEGPDTREADRSPPLRLGFPLPWWAARRDTTAIKRYGARLSRGGVASQPPMLGLYSRGGVASELPMWDLYLYAASKAYLALARGDTVAAAAQFQALPATSGFVWYERLTLAQALSALGREREALAVLDREFPAPIAGIHRGIWALERARLADRLGDHDKARHWYGYVSRLWRHADPELQPVVNETREALKRLTAEGQR